jgi:prepilin-type N-terminal cleavage/methylation domain-containing protein
MIPNTKCRHGFTLIELLVVVAVFMILAVLVTNSLFSILKSNTKANIMKEIRQNGTYALDVMDKTISGGVIDDAACTGVEGSSLTVKNPVSEETVIFRCNYSSDLAYIASNDVQLTGPTVTVENCSRVFRCEKINSDKKVTISFTLKQLGTPARPEETARQTFTKTIFLRNK